MLKNYNKAERSWILYDVANSAYTLTITTVLFPILWKTFVSDGSMSEAINNRYFLIATGFISLILAVLSPILGAISDFNGNKMKLFKISLYSGVAFSVLLCIPSIPWELLLIIYSISSIFYTAANVFYDAFLIDVTDEERYNKVSSAGYAWGYIGSCVPFILGMIFYALVVFKVKLPFNLTEKGAISIAFLISIIWWIICSIPMLKNVKQKYYVERDEHWFKQTFIRLNNTIKKIVKQPKLLYYLIAYFFFIDAVYTIIKTCVQIGSSFDNVKDEHLLAVVFIVQIIAFPCAILFGKMTKKFGEIKMLIYGILVYTVISVLGYFLGHMTNNVLIDLFIFAGLIGTAQGGLQAVSRSYFGKLIPKNESGEYYGFFNIFGRFASVLGPFLMALILELTGEVRYATLSLLPLLILGLIFLLISNKHPMVNNKQ